MKLPRVYPILDTGALEARGFPLTRAAAAWLEGGAGILQLRHKDLWGRAAFEAAREIARMCREAGALFIVDCLTDNNQRTISEVRSCFTKTNSKLAAHGSVAMSFDHVAVLSFKGDNEDQVLEAMFAADVAVEDVESKDGYITIFAPPAEFYKAKTALLEAFPNVELETQEITFLPQATKTLVAEDLAHFEKLLEMLHDCDDVQDIYHNVVRPGSGPPT